MPYPPFYHFKDMRQYGPYGPYGTPFSETPIMCNNIKFYGHLLFHTLIFGMTTINQQDKCDLNYKDKDKNIFHQRYKAKNNITTIVRTTTNIPCN